MAMTCSMSPRQTPYWDTQAHGGWREKSFLHGAGRCVVGSSPRCSPTQDGATSSKATPRAEDLKKAEAELEDNSEFLRRLQSAYAEAVASGDTAAAAAVEIALQMEGAHPQAQKSSPLDPCSGTPQGMPSMARGRRGRDSSAHVDPSWTRRHTTRSSVFSSPVRAAMRRCGTSRRRPCERAVAEQLEFKIPSEERVRSVCRGEEPAPDPRARVLQLGKVQCGRVRALPGQHLQGRAEVLLSDVDMGIQVPSMVESRFSENPSDVPSSSDLPYRCRFSIGAWARGQVSGLRCLLCLQKATWVESEPQGEVGKASWRTLLNVSGMASGSAMSLWEKVLSQRPVDVLREAVDAVRKEAAIDTGPITVEEFHLGLRSLEIRTQGERGGAAKLCRQVWRELVRVHVRLPCDGVPGEEEELNDVASVLPQMLALTPEQVEAQGRRLKSDALRRSLASWDRCASMLSRLARTLREDLDAIKIFGPFLVLGVDVDVTDLQLRRAYLDLCRQHHPDKGGCKVAFQQLQRAYEQIVDDRKRGVHLSRGGEKPSPPPAADAWGSEVPRHRSGCPTPPPRAPSRQQHSETAAVEGQEALRKLERLRTDARMACEQARAAAEAADAAGGVIQAEALDAEISDTPMAFMAAPALVSAMHTMAESAVVAARCAAEASNRVLPAAGTVSDGNVAEDLIRVCLDCTAAGTAAAEAATSCAHQRDEVEEVLGSMQREEQEVEAGVPALAAAAARACVTTAEAVECTLAAERAITKACEMVRVGASSGRTRRTSGEARGLASEHESEAHAVHTCTAASERRAPSLPPSPSVCGDSPSARLPPAPPRSSSAKASRRSGADVLLRQRSATFAEVVKLNEEVCALQREMHQTLVRTTLLIPSVSLNQKAVVFSFVSEVMRQAALDLQELSGVDTAAVSEVVPWLPGQNCRERAVHDVRTGALKLAALIDFQTLFDLLMEGALPMLTSANKSLEGAIRTAMAGAVAELQAWVEDLGSVPKADSA